jgi:hypothetical protein
MANQEFVPLLVLLMEELINSNPLAKEFSDYCLRNRIDFRELLKYRSLEEGGRICDQELQCA